MAKTGDMKVVYDGHKKFMDAMKALNTVDVKVGIPDSAPARKADEGDFDPQSNAAIGYIQENGSDLAGIPPRPFLIPGVKKVEKQIAEEFKKAAQECFEDPSAVIKRLTRAGIIAMNSVKQTLTLGEGFPELADSTLAAREARGFKGTRPLIETQQLRGSITYVLDDGR
jgi:hypothetical protein